MSGSALSEAIERHRAAVAEPTGDVVNGEWLATFNRRVNAWLAILRIWHETGDSTASAYIDRHLATDATQDERNNAEGHGYPVSP
ncbi:hypothetical protein [Alienimonas chondri]|uniref:hypothetical protein n=1 Tax=Alienimonas chondri TaxID=2681879 RepID=UPI001488CC5B|nr:hypothetical protein [Alienimonas chondri]